MGCGNSTPGGLGKLTTEEINLIKAHRAAGPGSYMDKKPADQRVGNAKEIVIIDHTQERAAAATVV